MYRAAALFVGVCGLILFLAFRVNKSTPSMVGIEFEPIATLNSTESLGRNHQNHQIEETSELNESQATNER